MAAKSLKTLEAGTAGAWRKWLATHHGSESEVWLIFHKRHAGRPSIAYQDAVDEALCFGWIDSLIKRLDEDRYARKFTPRKADSVWSTTNRTRYAALKREGRLRPAGKERPPTDRGPAPRPATPTTVPTYILTALERHPSARRCFDRLAPSHKRRYVMWIDSAKHAETKTRRLNEAIRMLTNGRPLGLK